MSFLVLLLILFALHQGSELEEVNNGFINGRSGTIVIDNNKYPHVSFQTSFDVDTETTDDIQLFNIISRALNLPRVQVDGIAPEMNLNIFSTPRGNFFFSFDGVSYDQLSQMDLKVLGQQKSFKVTRTSRPYSPAAALATTLTGQPPRNHGIVHGREELRQSNLFDVAAHVYPEAQIISGSYFHGLSHLFETKVNGAYYWDNVKHSFKQTLDTVEGENQLLVGQKEFESFLGQFGRSSLDDQSSWPLQILHAELLFVYNAAKHLAKGSASPNFLNFHFHSFSVIASKFGNSSPELLDAVKFVDEVLASILHQFPEYSYELLFLPSVHQPEVKSQIELVAGAFPQLNLKHWPQIRLTRDFSGEEISRVCSKIRSLIQSPTTKVYCFFSESQRHAIKRSVYSVPSNDTVADFFGPVEYFHLFVWFFIFLAIVIIAAVFMLIGIEVDPGVSSTSAYVQKDSRR